MFTKLKKSTQGESERGFTIIEVMIVLAIAGLILLIVFLAVPALQRNSRNTQRKSDAAHLASLINDYESNNNGKLPTGGFGTGANQLDLSGENWSIETPPTAVVTPVPASPATPAIDNLVVYTTAKCSGTTVIAGDSARQFAVFYAIEGSTKTQCIQG